MHEATALQEQHEALSYFLGEWDVEMEMTSPALSEPAQGTGTYEWIFEGRWLSSRVEVDLMGSPWMSYSMIGFDTYAKGYVIATVSSIDTALNVARGAVVDPPGELIAAYGTLDEYTTGELHKPFKVLIRIEDPDHHAVEIWDLGVGEAGAKVVEMRYLRRQAGSG